MPAEGSKPARWAADLTLLLNAALGIERFPVDVARLALDYSRQRWPEDRVMSVEGGHLPGFEGALIPMGKPRIGWGILYNRQGVSEGRRRFTLAHEFGHYLMHRALSASGIYCDEGAVVRGEGLPIEREADLFAASLLMPLDDFRQRIPPRSKPDIDILGACALHYGVSLTAITLRWLEYTERRSMLIVSTDGFALWSRSSRGALRTGRFIRTSEAPFELPSASHVGRGDFSEEARQGVAHGSGVWFDERTEECSIRSSTYDQALTILHFEDRQNGYTLQEETIEDVFDHLTR